MPKIQLPVQQLTADKSGSRVSLSTARFIVIMRLNVVIRALLCGGFLLLASSSRATTLYVAPAGSDSNPGTLELPF